MQPPLLPLPNIIGVTRLVGVLPLSQYYERRRAVALVVIVGLLVVCAVPFPCSFSDGHSY